jgi:SNF2 family DNA or RNA helicase
VAWLLTHEAAILADDMGLGKTVQAITALRLLYNEGAALSTLLLCPKSLLANWEEELARWAPELSCVSVTPFGSQRAEVWSAIYQRCHVLITNYEQMRQPPTEIVAGGVSVVIADEAHRVRNLSKITRGVRHIARWRFWALTGTPIERDSEDLASLLSTIAPKRFAPSDGKIDTSILRARGSGFLLRRRKESVLDDLPAVIESNEMVELLPEQWRSYRSAARVAIRTPSSSGNFLALINKLRAICDADPLSGKSAKVDRIVEIVENIHRAAEKCVIFSYLIKPIEILGERLAGVVNRETVTVLLGSMAVEERNTAIKEFKSRREITALLASSKVAAEGLTLTEANHVIFLNEWWNPSANAQARDRVLRIGQNVVFEFISLCAVEQLRKASKGFFAKRAKRTQM